MKKSYYRQLLVIVIVLVTTVLLSVPASADTGFFVTIIIDPFGGGGVEIDGEPYIGPTGPYEAGTVITLTATPNVDEGYFFDSWSILGSEIDTATTIYFEVQENHVITASFRKACYTLTKVIDPPDWGSIATIPIQDTDCPLPEAGQFTVDSTIELSATEEAGYEFKDWTLPTGTNTNPSIPDFLMDEDHTVTANFIKACRELRLSQNGPSTKPLEINKGSSGGCSPGYYKVGEQLTLEAFPISGWKVTGWTRNDELGTVPPSSSTPNEYSFIFPALSETEFLSITVNIAEKATFGFTTEHQSVSETVGSVDLEVKWDENTLPADASIGYKTVNGTAVSGDDYNPTSGKLNFTAGDKGAQIITVSIKDDNDDEVVESFYVDLSIVSPTSSDDVILDPARVEIQINDDEQPTIRFEKSVYTESEPESTTLVTVAVVVSPLPVNGNDVYVDFSTQDDTATAGEDYEAVNGFTFRIQVSEGKSRDTARIRIYPDDLDEADEETILLKLNPASAVNAIVAPNADATLKIRDNDDLPITGFEGTEYYIKKEGNSSKDILVRMNVPSGRQVDVDYTVTLNRTKATIEQGTLTFSEGEETKTITVPIDAAIAGDVLALLLSNPVNTVVGSESMGLYGSANLYVLDTDLDDCNELQFTYSGYGQPPAAMSKSSSLGCPSGYYVEGEVIDISAQPDFGWRIEGWQGTTDDGSTAAQNSVEMPDTAYSVRVDYRMPIFFAVVNKPKAPFAGPDEEEPNSLFSLANGPIVFDRNYYGNFSEASDINDIYYFVLGETKQVTITLDDIPSDRDYDLALYNESWADGYIAASQEFDNDPEKIVKTVPAGKYYVQVYSGSSDPSISKYRMKVTID